MYAANAQLILSSILRLNKVAREIPWIYTFIDPFYVDVSGGALSSFVKIKHMN